MRFVQFNGFVDHKLPTRIIELRLRLRPICMNLQDRVHALVFSDFLSGMLFFFNFCAAESAFAFSCSVGLREVLQ